MRLPGLLLFLGLGMLLGSEGIGGIEFNDYRAAQTAGTIGLVLILFEGGLTAGWHEIRPVLGTGDRAGDARHLPDRDGDRRRRRSGSST